jgi:ferric-dicitrate binding protein FerR (iron transport regulator)
LAIAEIAMTTSLIFNVLSGLASVSEKAEFEKWLAARQSNRREFARLKERYERDVAGQRFEEGLTRIRIFVFLRQRKRERWQRVRGVFAFGTGLVVVFFIAYYISLRLQAEPRVYAFEHERLGNIIETFERDYGVRIDVTDPVLRACFFSGVFYNESAEAMVRQIAARSHLGLTLEKKGRFKLSGAGCSR